MEDAELKTIVVQSYIEFLEENNLQDSHDSICLYLSSEFYNIQDDLELNSNIFCIPKELEGIEAQRCIETKIINIIQKWQEEKIRNLLDRRESISLTNYTQRYDNEDRRQYIKELEERFNCNIDFINYHIEFSYN